MHFLSDLSLQEVDLILEGLSELPAKRSFVLMTKIRAVVSEQIEEEKKKEEKKDE
jgi:hypothetical protein